MTIRLLLVGFPRTVTKVGLIAVLVAVKRVGLTVLQLAGCSVGLKNKKKAGQKVMEMAGQ